NLPNLIMCIRSIREIGDPFAVRGPAWDTIDGGRIRCHLPKPSSVSSRDVNAFFRLARIEGYPESIRRWVGVRPQSRSRRDPDWPTLRRSSRVRGHLLDVPGLKNGGVRDSGAIPRNRQVADEGCRRRYSFRCAQRLSSLLINGDPPEIHAPAAIAGEVE